MGRSNNGKPFYVDVGTSIVAVRCASNHDVIVEYDYGWHPSTLNLAKEVCDRMNKEAEIGRPLRNCDVGTPEEQEKRLEAFCAKHFNYVDDNHCAKCPIFKNDSLPCVYRFLQTPYKEGGAS
jgi:hypothetical protein